MSIHSEAFQVYAIIESNLLKSIYNYSNKNLLQEVIQEYMEKRAKRRHPVFKEIDPKCLRWHPPNSVNHTVSTS